MGVGLLVAGELTVAYGPVLAVNRVSLEVAEAGSTCLLGPNGAGKTTLLRAPFPVCCASAAAALSTARSATTGRR